MQLPGYRDLALLGRGGYSEVYRAYQEQFDRWVALKVLTFALTDERAQRRFLRECRLAGRLSAHPNIVTVYDAAIGPDGRPFISMELYPSGSIADAVRNNGPLHIADTLRFGIALAGALETAHRAGVVHRDVKPANVLMASYGQPLLGDFGLSVVAEHHEVSASTDAFTPYHAPPEVLERRAVTPRSDVYSLASTVYTMLAGRAAHQRDGNDSIASLLLRILNEDVPRLDLPGMTASLTGALQAALARDPDARTPSALSFAYALQDAQVEIHDNVTEPVVMEPSGPAADAPFEPATLPPPEEHLAAFQSPTTSGEPPGPVRGPVLAPPGPPGSNFAPNFDGFDTQPPPGDTTVHRERRPPQPERLVATVPKRSWRSTVLIVGGSLAVGGIAAFAAWNLTSDDDGTDDEPPDEEVVATDIAKPTGLVVAADNDAGIELRWDATDGRDSFAVLVLSESQAPRIVPVQGAPEYLIPPGDLSQDRAYCFLVAYADADGLGGTPSGQAATAFSTPECINGASENTVLQDEPQA